MGKCRYCGDKLMSESAVCISCYRRYWSPCHYCVSPKGAATNKHAYRDADTDQIVLCPVCKGTRGKLVAPDDVHNEDYTTRPI